LGKFTTFIKNSEKLRRISPFIIFYLIIFTPAINISKIDNLILINGLLFFIICFGFIIFTIKEYKNHTNL